MARNMVAMTGRVTMKAAMGTVAGAMRTLVTMVMTAATTAARWGWRRWRRR